MEDKQVTGSPASFPLTQCPTHCIQLIFSFLTKRRDFRSVRCVSKVCHNVASKMKVPEDFSPEESPFYKKYKNRDPKPTKIVMEILDTAGTERFTAMRDLYMKNGEGFVLVYSVIAQSTFNDLSDLREQIIRVKDRDDVPMILVGNKSDLDQQRVISTEQGRELARKFGGIPFMETSAKDNVNITELFETLARIAPRSKDSFYHRDDLYKFVVLGSGGVGKSHITVRYVLNIFPGKYDPTIEDTYRKETTITYLPVGQAEKPKQKSIWQRLFGR